MSVFYLLKEISWGGGGGGGGGGGVLTIPLPQAACWQSDTIVSHGPTESSLLMAKLRVSNSSEMVVLSCLASSMRLCLFERMRLTASRKTRMEVCTYEKCALRPCKVDS